MSKSKHLCFLLLLLLALPVSAKRRSVPDSLLTLRIPVGPDTIVMHRVEGGMFVMGATPEQRSDKVSSDRPSHCVSLSTFYIGETEVTKSLWRTVMGSWPQQDSWTNPREPANWISYNDCLEFCRRLDSLLTTETSPCPYWGKGSGERGLFRLPTEAEWEYAARGGNKSAGYRFAGSDFSDEVGWGLMNAGHKVHEVAQKKPNELGLYDMTGNVNEWCRDGFAPYYMATEPNPQGPDSVEERVLRGGSWDNCEDNRHISYRHHHQPDYIFSDCGLRLALTHPWDTVTEQKAPEMHKRVKIGRQTVSFVYVADSVPYYIQENEVTFNLWREVMKDANIEKSKLVITGTRRSDRLLFVERAAKMAGLPMAEASDEQVSRSGLGITLEVGGKARTKSLSDAEKQKKRKTQQNSQKWADLIGVKVKVDDDPILNNYSLDPVSDRPFRLVLR